MKTHTHVFIIEWDRITSRHVKLQNAVSCDTQHRFRIHLKDFVCTEAIEKERLERA